MEKSESSSDDKSCPWQSYHTVYTNAKAGMEEVDKEKVQRIVYEMSKGSKYFVNEERKEAQIKEKIEHLRARCEKLTSADLSYYRKVVDKRILELEATRDLSKVWLHVDMDAFYAAVETLSNPSLKGKPMAVGSMSMISTANYEARKFGVRAAMPGFIARKLCPQLIFVPTDFTKYTYYSGLTRKVFQNYDANFLAASLDEAYLDITDVCREKVLSGGEIAEKLRSSVYAETGLTCSAGVAPNRLLAKVCSDINKPNGQFILPNDRMAVVTFISSLPIRKIGGIGKVTEHILKDALGISTCEQMLQKGCLLYAVFSRSTADTPQASFRKSISNERTFAATEDETVLFRKLDDIAEILSADMQRENLSAKTLTLKLKTASFEIRTRAVTLQRYICSREDILKLASKLLKAELPVSLRLIGLRMSQFNEEKGRDPDPTQKAITNFIVQKTSMKNLDDGSFLYSDVSGNSLRNDKDASLSLEAHETNRDKIMSEIKCEDVQYLNGNGCTSNSDANKDDGNQVPENNENANTGNACPSPSSRENEGFQVANRSDRRKATMSETVESEAVSSSNQIEPLFWVDGYKCAFCGIELPQSFSEERQEHSDFHLAERLQREESAASSTTSMSRRRLVKKANPSKSKKHKSSSMVSKHIPIDLFFVKSNQNF